jgi:hypothetical protein
LSWGELIIPSSPIKALFLDRGDVFLTNGWDNHIQKRAADKFGLDYDEMNECHHLTFDTYEEGKLSLDEYLNRVVFYQERSFSREEFKAFIYTQSQPFPEMIELMCWLKTQHGLLVAAASNEGRELTVYRIQQFKLGAFIDFLSHPALSTTASRMQIYIELLWISLKSFLKSSLHRWSAHVCRSGPKPADPGHSS